MVIKIIVVEKKIRLRVSPRWIYRGKYSDYMIMAAAGMEMCKKFKSK